MTYHPWVNVTLTSGLVSRNYIKSGAYLLYSLRQEVQIWCVDASMDGSVTYHFWGTVNLTSDLVFRIFLSRAYRLYYLYEESQIQCVDGSWDDGVSCTILESQ